MKRLLPALIFIALMCTASAWLLLTESGLRTAFRLTQPMLASLVDIHLEAGQLNGRLIGPLEVRTFEYRDRWVQVKIDEAHIEWQPSQLLSANVQIDRLLVNHVGVTLLPQPQEDADTETFGAAYSPVTVNLEDVRVMTAELLSDPDAKVLHGSNLETTVRVHRDRVKVEKITAMVLDSEANVSGHIVWNTPYPIWLDASLVQGLAGNEALKTNLTASGDLTNFALNLSTAAPYPSNLDMEWNDQAEGYAVSITGTAEPAALLVAFALLPEEALKTGAIDIDAQALITGAGLKAGTISIKQNRSEFITTGDLNWAASGRQWPGLDLQWRINSPHMGELWPLANGTLQGEGKLKGQWPDLLVAGNLNGNNLGVSGNHLESLDIQADLDLGKDQAGSLSAKIQGLRLAGSEPAHAKFRMQGKRSEHQIDISWQHENISGQAQVTGQWYGGSHPWLVTVEKLSARPRHSGVWKLVSPFDLHIGTEKQAFNEACLEHSRARLCANSSQASGQWQSQLKLDEFPLETLNPWLPETLHVRGLLNAKSVIQGEASHWRTLNLVADSNAQIFRPDQEEHLDVTLTGLALNASPAFWSLEAKSQINHSGRMSIEAAAEPRNGDLLNAKIRGDLKLDMPQLNELAVIAPEIEQLRGELKGDINFTGTLSQPIPAGSLALVNGRLDLRDYGISLSPLSATITGRPDGVLDLNLKTESGQGKMYATGQARLGHEPSLLLNVTGENFLAARMDEATVYISPDVLVKVTSRQVDVSGTLTVPEAKLSPRVQNTSVQRASADQVLVDETAAQAKKTKWNILARLRLILGDRVSFEGLGLKTRLTGQLDLSESPGRLTQANGEIRLEEGSYEIYGQKLDIDRGRLVFANAPVTQPALDIKASRTPRVGVTVGVKLRGLLDNPTVSLFSTPSMRQEEQLSYLVLGRPLEGNEGNPTLAGAALALGLKRGDKYIQGIGDVLPVDDIGIETQPGHAAQQASLVVGKYLSPRLYISYGAGLFEPLHKLRLRYRLSERWTVVGESGTTQGADVLYTIER